MIAPDPEPPARFETVASLHQSAYSVKFKPIAARLRGEEQNRHPTTKTINPAA